MSSITPCASNLPADKAADRISDAAVLKATTRLAADQRAKAAAGTLSTDQAAVAATRAQASVTDAKIQRDGGGAVSVTA